MSHLKLNDMDDVDIGDEYQLALTEDDEIESYTVHSMTKVGDVVELGIEGDSGLSIIDYYDFLVRGICTNARITAISQQYMRTEIDKLINC